MVNTDVKKFTNIFRNNLKVPFDGYGWNTFHGSQMLVQTGLCLPLSTRQGMVWNSANQLMPFRSYVCAKRAYREPNKSKMHTKSVTLQKVSYTLKLSVLQQHLALIRTSHRMSKSHALFPWRLESLFPNTQENEI